MAHLRLQAQARALVAAILADTDTTISVWDGEDWALKRSRDTDAILEALGSTDADTVRVLRSGKPAGSFWLIYGNGPGELIADHGDNAYCNGIWNALNL